MNNAYKHETYPLSPLQEGMLFHSLASIGTGVDIEQIICSIHEQLDVEAFQRAWSRVVERHAVLRSQFEWRETDEPRQVVIPEVSFKGECFDWKSLSIHEQEKSLETYIQKDRAQGFDIGQAPLMRLAIFELGNEEYKFIWTFHHILLDGRAFPLILEEVFTFYEAFIENRDIELGSPRPYRDYVMWVGERDFAKDEKFWREHLGGFSSPTPLIVGAPLSAEKKTMGAEGSVQIRIPRTLTSALRHFSSSNGLTMNTLFEGAWTLLLSRYNNEEDILYGTTRSCRGASIEGAESMIGLLINTVPIRVKIGKQTKMIDWLKQLREQHVQMRDYIHSPLYEIQRWSDIAHGSPLFESLVVFENYYLNSYMQSKGGRWVNREFEYRGRTNYPLVLVGYDDDEMLLRIEFDEGRFTRDTIQRMLGHLQTILQNIPGNLDTRIVDIPMLTQFERNQLLVEWNATQIDYPRDKCIHELFEEQVNRTPDAIALVFEDQQMTYGELDRKANQLASYLKKLGVGPDVLVGTCMERSSEMVVGLIGILKAGGAYAPIDSSYPKERLAFMVEDTGMAVLLTQSVMVSAFPVFPLKMLCLDTEWETVARESDQNVPACSTAEGLAYVMYTSGSTGTPKGVEVLHRGVVRLVINTNYSRLNEKEIFLLMAPISFDASTFELWAALLNGATCIIYPADVPNADKLADIIRRHFVSTLWLTSSLFNAFIDENPQALRGISQLLIGGEQLSVPHVLRAQEGLPGTQIINGYGPTENTTFTCCYSIPQGLPQDTTTIPIGRPIANTQVYILDKHRQPVPVGVPGELYTGGDGLARGYLNRHELTAEKFIPDPFSAEPGARLYKTGDLVRYCPDGTIEFLGRIDQQVKIRGFRIELGEIESVLGQHEVVREVVVMAREDVPGDKRLVAYIVPEGEQTPSVSVLRQYLKEKLPEYMVPNAYVLLEKFPLSQNGKVDRRSLPTPEHTRPELEETYIAPRTPVEQSLSEIWADVLGVERVGVNDNFFELGGYSLLAVRLFVRIRKWSGIDLPLATLFKSPTVRALAELIDPSSGTAPISRETMSEITSPVQQWRSLVPIQPEGKHPPVFLVHAIGGNVLNYLPLLHYLGPDQPVYGLQARGLDGVLSPHSSMKEMASHYIAEIRSVQSSGPYFLGGASFGGTVALEIAQQLTEQGEKVALLVLFDSVGPGAHGYRYWRTSLRSRLSLNGGGLAQKTPLLLYFSKRLFQYFTNRVRNLRCSFFRLTKRPIPLELRERELLKYHNKCLISYMPHPYLGPITLFRGPAGNAWPYNDPELGWKDIAKGELKTIIIDAHHLEFMEPPELGVQFAEELRLMQDKVQCSGPEPNGFIKNESVGAKKSVCG
jgi:surfactin family lipopeptide synthetase C